MEHKFRVWIDGVYYHDDLEYDVEIDLTDDEVATIKKLINDYDGELRLGLMPILEAGSDELYQKFYDTIFPEVFLELFRRDDMFEPNPGDENRHWDVDDFEYLMETYGDGYNFEEAYIVKIPKEMMPPKMHLTKGMSKDDILEFIRKWDRTRNDVFDNICALHDIYEPYHEDLYKFIEERLTELAEKVIEKNDEATLALDDFDPFNSKYVASSFDLANEIYDAYTKKLE